MNAPRLNARTIRLALVVCLALLAASCSSSASNSADSGLTLDDLAAHTVRDVDGNEVRLDAFTGEPLVVNYFAGWCPPCRGEIPAFVEVADNYRDQVTVIGISRDNDEDAWRSFVAETGATFPTFYEGQNDGTFEAAGALGMPTTLFVHPDGSVAKVHSGALTAEGLTNNIEEELIDG